MPWQTVQDQIAEAAGLRRALTLATVCRAVAVKMEEQRYAAALEKVRVVLSRCHMRGRGDRGACEGNMVAAYVVKRWYCWLEVVSCYGQPG